MLRAREETLATCLCSVARAIGARATAYKGRGPYRSGEYLATCTCIHSKMQLCLTARRRLANFFISVAEVERQVSAPRYTAKQRKSNAVLYMFSYLPSLP